MEAMGRTTVATNAGLVGAGLVASLYLWVRATGHGLPLPALPFVREPEPSGVAALVEHRNTPNVRPVAGLPAPSAPARRLGPVAASPKRTPAPRVRSIGRVSAPRPLRRTRSTTPSSH